MKTRKKVKATALSTLMGSAAFLPFATVVSSAAENEVNVSKVNIDTFKDTSEGKSMAPLISLKKVK